MLPLWTLSVYNYNFFDMQTNATKDSYSFLAKQVNVHKMICYHGDRIDWQAFQTLEIFLLKMKINSSLFYILPLFFSRQ